MRIHAIMYNEGINRTVAFDFTLQKMPYAGYPNGGEWKIYANLQHFTVASYLINLIRSLCYNDFFTWKVLQMHKKHLLQLEFTKYFCSLVQKMIGHHSMLMVSRQAVILL